MSKQVSDQESEWRVLDFAKGYSVDQYGNVKSLKRIIIRKCGKPYPVSERILKQRKYRYATVDLKLGHMSLVHRLVGSAFLGLDYNDSLDIINHKDGDKLNNSVHNLERCNHSHNAQHSFDVLGRVAHNKGISRISQTDRIEIRKLYEQGMLQKDIANIYKVSRPFITGVCNEPK